MQKDILCTIGPASMNRQVISRLDQLGASLFRINLSHTELKDVAATIQAIRDFTDVPICLDTEGAQIRTGNFVQKSFDVAEHSVIRAHKRRVPGDGRDIYFHPTDIIDKFALGDFISIDFNAVLVQVIARGDGHIDMRVLNGGEIGRNKAVTVHRDIPMDCLSEKDRGAIAIGRDMGIRHFALSFANTAADVDEIRGLAGDDSFIISKIECENGLLNLDDIIERSDAILIDRGDLSRQLPIETIPRTQKNIIRRAKEKSRKVYVATNLLESMVNDRNPTRAEVNDIYNTLTDGADGLVLAAETAIGAHPIACANMIVRMLREFERGDTSDAGVYPVDLTSLLIEPHGGRLVANELDPGDIDAGAGLERITLGDSDLMDVRQIANGTYSPLAGFMDAETLGSVLGEYRTPSGVCWTLPVILQLGEQQPRCTAGDRVLLCAENGDVHGVLDVSEIYSFDMTAVVRQWFGTDDRNHPGVRHVMDRGNRALAGRVSALPNRALPHAQYTLAPNQTRFIFSQKGWSRVVGFHTRNPAHRVHEHIQMAALERSSADGLFISPVIGPKKPGDFLPEPIIESYQALLDFGIYPPGRVVLGSFASYSRYAGPREAVFTALCRKNMGCSHFIIGRDHTGVGDYYAPDANIKLFEKLDGLEIEPLFFDAIGYDAENGDFRPLTNGTTVAPISGTEVRERLRKGEALPDWFMRDVVQDVLARAIAQGEPVFHD